MFKKLQRKIAGTGHKKKCSILIEVQKLESIPDSVKQVKVVWEKNNKIKATTDVCTVYKGDTNSHLLDSKENVALKVLWMVRVSRGLLAAVAVPPYLTDSFKRGLLARVLKS
jgi:hypothetical protein